ncbi:30S ribosomal protein S8 [Pseudofulvimonas gallinarii]|jgi:small subunit ribosomal protein S8|uniref:Small ribosomal subunit protein uS8 n=1 Tax=Pseudofulvimonas gallinarii TaxID=634155 RepID=A0A4S3KYI8_9GAMM|nr:30S ribosomal protein S8 [Pseudofulvimonas gallinarii]TCS98527.1 SSU ribosomal protein S8P [Pseudofulvimonas gallinarii]THD13678.1 30S ribosomal protein S8 [Pseudofulvimonas gallinarii]
MSMTDPIADMFSRIKNAQGARKQSVRMPASKLKLEIARVLKEEGYITDVATRDIGPGKKEIEILLKYFEGRPVIEQLRRVSRPGLRQYRGKNDLPKVLGGMGISIVTTSKGVMTDAHARKQGLGGEVLAVVA